MQKPPYEDVMASYLPHELLSMALDAFINRVHVTGANADARKIEIGKRDLDTALRMFAARKLRDAGRAVPGLVSAATTRTTPDPLQTPAAAEPWN